jgi:hypothetical protein
MIIKARETIRFPSSSDSTTGLSKRKTMKPSTYEEMDCYVGLVWPEKNQMEFKYLV